ncbi:MAG TPA: methyl-accepting chemotaxis protein, partial [Aquabacterium sp.]|nr:methyl-accepting chemotaxis protein [Aquabacterium sp.]
ASLDMVIAGARTDATKEHVLASVDKAHAIASRVDVELFAVEQWAFRLMGYGGVIDLPHKDMKDLDRVRERLQADSGPLTAELARSVRADMDVVLDNSNQFGPLVAEAVDTVKAIVLTINLLGISALIGSFWVIRQATLAPLNEALVTARRIAQGDLSGPVPVHAQDEMGQLMQALADMQDSLARVVADVRQRSESVAGSMSEVASGHGDLSQRTEQQAATIQQTASSVEELSSSVQHSVERVREADQRASSAAQVALTGGQTVEQVVHSMGQILSASRKISDIISVIDGIAFQTNILALNAAVEAARAGEQGRGFAVVASEVRQLAQRSASAAKEIATLIRDSVEKVESGSTLVTQAGSTIQEVVDAVQTVSTLISEVNGALSEQASGITLIDQAMTHLDQATQQNAALAEQSVSAVESVRNESAALVGAVGQFRLP